MKIEEDSDWDNKVLFRLLRRIIIVLNIRMVSGMVEMN